MPGNLCEHCTGYCCRYIALPIDTPTDRDDFDDIRWYLLHEGVSVFVEDGEWYINIATTCRHLQPDYRCGIYETRPQICRDYSTDNCDYHSGDYGWEHHFTSPEHLDDYAQRYLDENGDVLTEREVREREQRRPRIKARLRGRQRAENRPNTGIAGQPERYAEMKADIRGVPLPVLGGRR